MTALRGWYLAFAEGIRGSGPTPHPEGIEDGPSIEVLRYLDEAVAAGDADRIRSAVGAALASDHVRNLRRLEPHLVRARCKLTGAGEGAPAIEPAALIAAR